MRRDFNSQRIWYGHNLGRHFVVWWHKYAHCDVCENQEFCYCHILHNLHAFRQIQIFKLNHCWSKSYLRIVVLLTGAHIQTNFGSFLNSGTRLNNCVCLWWLRRCAFRNRRRSVACFIWLTLNTHVNQIYIRHFKERGMCYKTDKILKKTLKKNFWKKIKSTLQRNVIAWIRTCNHLHEAPKIAP